MKFGRLLFFLLVSACACSARTGNESRQEAEYYVAAYARHYNVPVEFVRAVVEQESGWQRCVVSLIRYTTHPLELAPGIQPGSLR
jgi:hypothetical protein